MIDLPPVEWFRDPELTELTPLTVTDDGHVFGHLAAWSQSHTSFPGRNITPPRSPSDYRWFHTGAYTVLDGDERREISVGSLTMNTGHAGTALDHAAAAAHYDHTGSVVAVVCAGEDQFGIWYSGAMLPDVDDLARRRFKACGLSGDWRSIERGRLDLVAALAVPHGGFPIPRSRVASGAPLALVAAGFVPPVARFGKRVAEGWADPASVEAVASFDPDAFADAIAARLEQRRRDGELSAQHAALVDELDDTAAVVAALLAEVDDSPQRMAALLAELADDGDDGEGDFFGRMPEQLKQDWLHGKTAAKIRWGTDGDFDRCVVQARKHDIPANQREGLCNNLHREALGKPPGKH